MGLSASQARFLQLTARRSNIEYQTQQINFQRLEWSNKLAAASATYQEKTSNRKLVFSYNDGTGTQKVDVTYTNYKNYMNQQMEGLSTSQDKYFLVSSSGNKIVVSSKEEMNEMINKYTTYTPISAYETNVDEDGNPLETVKKENEQGVVGDYVVKREYTESDFLIADDLDDVDNFQNAIQNGVYYFATRKVDENTNEFTFQTQGWETLGGGAISEDYDKSDDAVAEAEYEAMQDKVQSIDKKLELQISKLESEREAIQTEIESVSKVIEDNVESSFKVFS